MATVTHTFVDPGTDWTQTDVDAAIARGELPTGTLASNMVKPSHWNADHTVVLGADENFVTDAQLTVIENTSGTNTGDQTNITGNAGTVTTINGHITAGTNVTITGSGTIASPYEISSSGGGGGAVDSVNGQTGVVVLDADDISDAATTNKFTTASDISKLAGIEAGADVTDATNVTAAGALMDSEVTNLAAVKAFDPTDYATAAQGALADSATQPGDLATVATTGSYNDLSDKPTIPTGTIDGTLTANEMVYGVDGNTVGSLAVATYPSLTEISYVKGVTSAIQTQLNAKQASGAYITASSSDTLTNKDLTSGTNTFPTFNQNTTGSAATLTTTRTIWGQNFNGSANVTGTLALGASDLTMTGSLAATGSRVTKGWFTDIESTNAPTVGGVAASGTGGLVRATTPSFTTTLGVGAATAAASGAGITFPATQSASSDANTLDDYEEGTWTPTIAGSGTAGVNTYVVQSGAYTKVGNTVTIFFYVQLTAKDGAMSGSYAKVAGFPFSPKSSIGYRRFGSMLLEWGGFSANQVTGGIQFQGGTSAYIILCPAAASAPALASVANITAGTYLAANFTYLTD